MSEAAYREHFDAYQNAKGRFLPHLRRRIAEVADEMFEGAATLHIHGYYNDQGEFVVRAVRVTDSDGNLVASEDDTPDEWDDISMLDDLLDFLGELTGEDYLGDDTIDVAAILDTSPPSHATHVVAAAFAVHVPATLGSTWRDAAAVVEGTLERTFTGGPQGVLITHCTHPDHEVLFHPDGPCPPLDLPAEAEEVPE